MGFQAASLRALGVDVKALARQRKTDQSAHALLPPHVLTMTRYWLKLGGRAAPRWSKFQLLDVAEIAPFLTIAESLGDNTHAFTFSFVGSAVSAVLGEDLSGRAFNAMSPVLGEIDWYRRCRPVCDTGDVQVVSGTTNPPYTAPIEFVAGDFPFASDLDGSISHVVGITIPRVN